MSGLINTLLGPIGDLLEKVIPDVDKKNQLAFELATMAEKHAQETALAQAKINEEAAKHPSLFVAGARPAILWICALGILTNFFIMPLAAWAVAIWAPGTALPDMDVGELMTLTMSMLGLSAIRGYEKTKGVARNNMGKAQ